MTGVPRDLIGQVADYYEGKLAQHGETARGVDWNGEESQVLRFEQLSRVIEAGESFSVNDLGCGWGACFEFLAARHPDFSYVGIDVAEAMVEAARRRFAGDARVRFEHGSAPAAAADYTLASGIFNVRLDRSDADWLEYLYATLDVLDRGSRRGFAFNCLTSYSDADKMRPHLYYADPCALFDRCKRRYSRQVALLHDYGLYEFTILVRKQP
jgi:SAM-dependent methyltransferase